MCELKSINADLFSKYGQVLEFPKDVTESFHIVITEAKEPWRLAVFRYRNKEVTVLENHATSLESFEPIKGLTVLVVAEHDTPKEYEAFILDKPICLYKGIWHQVLSLTEEAQVKISENLDVTSEFYELERAIKVFVN